MNIKKLGTTAILAASLPLSVHAANWLQVQGNEAPDSGVFKPFGFFQPTYTYIDADPIQGLLGGAALRRSTVSTRRRTGSGQGWKTTGNCSSTAPGSACAEI